jgi:hypothetical protein
VNACNSHILKRNERLFFLVRNAQQRLLSLHRSAAKADTQNRAVVIDTRRGLHKKLALLGGSSMSAQ